MGNLTPRVGASARMLSNAPVLDSGIVGDPIETACSAPQRERTEPRRAPTAQALRRAIEAEILPRLLLAHRASTPAEPAEGAGRIGPADHARFLELVMRETASATRAFVAALLSRGVSHQTLYLDLLSHTARRLGEMWEEDRCDFSDVTIGLCRLHEVLREHTCAPDPGARFDGADAPRVLLATACADQHVFGVVMVAEFFRRDGWRVWSEPGATCGQLAALVGELHFAVLCLSAACSALVDDVAAEIGTLRKASCNDSLRVLVGGRLFAEAPQLVGRVGADGSAGDALSAPQVAYELLQSAPAAAAP